MIELNNPPTPEQLWRWAIWHWHDGSIDQVERLLRSDKEIPPFAREWLAKVLAGEVKRRRGRRKDLSFSKVVADYFRGVEIEAAYERHLVAARADVCGGGTPTERAIAATAEELGIKESAVSAVVHPRVRGRSLRPQGTESG